ncbi:hypothetical protein D3C78_730290 [compost metagenome]
MGQPARHELLKVGALLGHPLEGEAHQGVGAAPQGQCVVAADDAKAPLVEGLPVDRVVDYVGLAAQGYVLHPLHQQAVRGRCGIVKQAEVRRHLLEFAVDAQDQAADPVVIRAYVDVHEGVRQHPVQVDPEAFQLAMEGLVIQLPDEGQQQVIEAPQPDRHAGDRGHMVIEDAQGIQGFVEIPWRRQLQPGGALAQELLVIRQHIARLVGGMTLEHVAQHPLRHRLGHLGRQRGIGQRILGGERQGMALLSG